LNDGKTMEQQSYTCINLREMGIFSENVSSIYDNTRRVRGVDRVKVAWYLCLQ